jgi:hypothetical protein
MRRRITQFVQRVGRGNKARMCTLSLLVISLFSVIACSNKPDPEAPSPPETVGARAALTAAACAAKGGEVVGDIGDGAVHRPDYRDLQSVTKRCPVSGQSRADAQSLAGTVAPLSRSHPPRGLPSGRR